MLWALAGTMAMLLLYMTPAALTSTSISIPIFGGRLALGTWQGIYLWEHRSARGQRTVVVHVGS